MYSVQSSSNELPITLYFLQRTPSGLVLLKCDS